MNAELLREICMQFPGAAEEMKWEHDLVFSVGGKMFCVTSFDEPFKASFKVEDEQFEELCHRKGFMPAPYLARAKWVQANNEAALSGEEWKEFARKSYLLVAAKLTKKQKAQLGIT